jgi:flagellar assembly factor FliW
VKIETSRFGAIEVQDEALVTFPLGLLGFPDKARWVLLEPENDAVFWWLQSADDPSLAFAVTDPGMFVPDYPLWHDPDVQMLVICNKYGADLTANLAGPLFVNTFTRQGEQRVLKDRSWSTRQPIVSTKPPSETLN